MKKYLLLLAAACMFVSCNKENKPDPTPTPTPTSNPKGDVEFIFRVDNNTAPHVKLNVLKDDVLVKTLTSTDTSYVEKGFDVATPVKYSTEFVYDTSWNNTEPCNVMVYLDPLIRVYDGTSDIAIDAKLRGAKLPGVYAGRIQDAMNSLHGFLSKNWTLSSTGIK